MCGKDTRGRIEPITVVSNHPPPTVFCGNAGIVASVKASIGAPLDLQKPALLNRRDSPLNPRTSVLFQRHVYLAGTQILWSNKLQKERLLLLLHPFGEKDDSSRNGLRNPSNNARYVQYVVFFMIRHYPDLVCYDDETYNGNLSENFLLRCNRAANYSRLNKQ
jgi:hypothetical protein